MSFALTELTRLLATSQTVLGVVVAVRGNQARIATAQGAITARTLDAVSPGDRVRIENGIATRAPAAQQTYPV